KTKPCIKMIWFYHRNQHDTRCCGLICEFAYLRIPKPWFVNTQTGYRYQTTCSILTPANKAALKALAIAKGGITVVPEIFSGEFWHFCGQKCKRCFAPKGGNQTVAPTEL